MPKPNQNGEFVIPQMLTMIRQPNRVTNAKYDYTLTQQRILLSVIKALQDAISQIEKGVLVKQLSLFQTSDDSITLQIPIKEIAVNKGDYTTIRNGIIQVASIPFQFSGVDPITGQKATRVGGLFTAYIPEDKYQRNITIEIKKEIAYRLISINEGWTKFAYEIAFFSKNKYTPRIYQLISRWKDRGGYRIAIEELREFLVLGDKYQTFKDLKKRILEPAQEELFEKADVWFEVGEVEREGKAPKFLNFKIITPKNAEQTAAKKNNIIGLLRLHFGFKDSHIENIRHLLAKEEKYQQILLKLTELSEYLNKNKGIANIPNYTLATLLKIFGESDNKPLN